MGMIDNFERMLQAGKDSPLLRYGLGGEYLKQGDHVQAALHLRSAVAQDPGYSAAWKLLGKCLTEAGDLEGARMAWQSGLAAAEAKGDKQAKREMTVFLKRLDRPAIDPAV
jgi:Tfp pilus assembly protein PilF